MCYFCHSAKTQERFFFAAAFSLSFSFCWYILAWLTGLFVILARRGYPIPLPFLFSPIFPFFFLPLPRTHVFQGTFSSSPTYSSNVITTIATSTDNPTALERVSYIASLLRRVNCLYTSFLSALSLSFAQSTTDA